MTRENGDRSNGYEALATEFIARRSGSNVGVSTVLDWAASLPAGASILDLGCGHGVPLSAVLINEGFTVYGIDASPTLAAAFRRNFPQAEVACEAVEESGFFGRTFEGILAVGLFFLLPAEVQQALIHRVALRLKPAGRFLFTSPEQSASWTDILTGRQSHSLGAEAYKKALSGAGLVVVDEYDDEGRNHYYDAARQ